MRKLFTLLSLFIAATQAQATIHTVSALSNNTFSPATLAVEVGDTIRFTQSGGSHNTVSQSVPVGAASWNHNFSSGDFDYKVTVAGNYGYVCTFHGGMVGGFVATEPTADVPSINEQVVSKVYPNPFKGKINITHRPGDAIEIVGLLGERVKMVPISILDKTTVLDLSDLRKGVYFYIVRRDNEIIETRRIVKSE